MEEITTTTTTTSTELNSNLLEQVLEAIDRGDLSGLTKRLKTLHAADIAHVLESLPPEDRTVVFDLIESERHGPVLAEVSEGVRLGLVKEMDRAELRQATETMEVDDAADLVGELPERVAKDLLDAMSVQERTRIEDALSYEEETAGGIMEPVAFTLHPEVTVLDVLRDARRQGLPGRTDKLFVVDKDGILKGSLRLSYIVSSPEDATVGSIMSHKPRTIHVDTSKDEVAILFERYDMISAAVIDDDNRLLGRITVDDVVDIIRDRGEQQMMNLAGVSEEEDLFAPVARTTRSRSLWLGLNLLAAFSASWVIGLFEATIQEFVALAVLMPIVASMGGNAGNQTLTVVIRGLALGQISSANRMDLLRKEVLVGFLNGLLFAAVVAMAAVLWFKNWMLGVVIALAMGINLVTAALLGGIIPLALKRFGIDPPLAGSVLVTTATDIVGFFVFLWLASLLIV